MSLHLPLGHFPSEILGLITRHLPALNIYQLASCSGDRTLQRKIFNGGVATITLSHLSLHRLGLKFLRDLRGLRRVSIDCFSYPGPIDLFDLPSHIVELRIEATCSLWLRENSGRKIYASPAPKTAHPHLHRDGESMFPLKHALPNLKVLDLICIIGICHHQTEEFVAHYLPPSITCLGLTHLSEVPPATIIASLPNLNTVVDRSRHIAPRSFQSGMTPPETTSFLLLAEALQQSHSTASIDHLSLLADPTWSQIPFIPHNVQSLSLDLVTNSQSALLRSLAPIWTTSSATASFGELQPDVPRFSLTARSIAFDDGVAGNKVSIDQLLPMLQDLVVLNHGLPISDFSALPKQLKSLLATGLLNEACVTSLPTSLTKLEFGVALSPEPCLPEIGFLPQSLTYLRISRDIGLHVNLLPRGLKTLRADIGCPTNEEFWNALPPGLTKLFSSIGQVEDSYLHLMPRSIAKLYFPKIAISGAYFCAAPYYSSTAKLIIPSSLTFTRLLDGTVSFTAAAWSDSYTDPFEPELSIVPMITSLPSSLTHLICEFSQTHPNVLDLPHLKRLEILSFHSFNWFSKLPSLTHLVLLHSNNQPEQHATIAMAPPPNLTHLSIKSATTDTTDIPVLFRPAILIFEESIARISYEFAWRQLPNVTSLSLAQTPLRASPPSGAATLTANLPLRHLSVLSTSWHVSEEQLRTIQKAGTLTSLECASLVLPSIKAYMSQPVDRSDEAALDFAQIIGRMVTKKFPFLKLAKGFIVTLSQPPSADITHLLGYSTALTTLTIGSFKLPRNFGKLIPRSISCLNVMEAAGIHCGTPRSLPETLKVLHINSMCFTRDAYQELPRGLETLILQNGKFWAKHASALPPNLLKLSISGIRLGDNGLENLPRTITGLELKWTANQNLCRGLPPNLKVFIIHCYWVFYFHRLDKTLLPKGIATLVINGAPSPTSLLMDIPSLFPINDDPIQDLEQQIQDL